MTYWARRLSWLSAWLLAACGSGDAGKGQGKEEGVPAGGHFLPCDVEQILDARCQRCHNTQEVRDACSAGHECVAGPFPLLSFDDTHAPYGKRKVFDAMGDAIESGFMPYQDPSLSPPVEPLTEGEKSTLLDWTARGAPPAAAACADGT